MKCIEKHLYIQMGAFIHCNFLTSSQFQENGERFFRDIYYRFPSILGTFETSKRAL